VLDGCTVAVPLGDLVVVVGVVLDCAFDGLVSGMYLLHYCVYFVDYKGFLLDSLKIVHNVRMRRRGQVQGVKLSSLDEHLSYIINASICVSDTLCDSVTALQVI
jgi:hypothetical protein